jgi:hypothetical protein
MPRPSRRAVVGAEAWTVPVITLASAAPAAASGSGPSGPVVAKTFDFNSIGTSLPTDFAVFTGVTTSFRSGTAAALTTTQTFWASTAGRFWNSAPATGLTATATTADQSESTNSVPGIRQSGAINDIDSTVQIRIVALTASSGAGSRPISAVDDVTVVWT